MTHPLHCYDYVNQPYEVVRRTLLADPQAVFRLATSTDGRSKLHVHLGAIELGARIEIEIHGVEENRDLPTRPTTTITLAWRSQNRAALFPLMTARLSLYPLTATETQLELDGTYVPPLGLVGEAVDTIALRRLAQEAVATFVRQIAIHLRRTLAAAQATA